MRLNAKQIIDKLNMLKSTRGVWETHWQDLTDYILPRKNNVIRVSVPGEKKGIELYDNTAMISCEVLVAALHGMLTNPNTLWFSLQTGHEGLDDQDHIASYLQRLTRNMHKVLNNSNFQPEVYEYYLDLVSVGTATLIAEEDENNVVRFSTKHVTNMYIQENNLGFIDDALRTFCWTASQLISEFMKDVKDPSEADIEGKLGKAVAVSYKKNDNKKFDVIHAVYKDDLTSTQKMPFLSQYILKDTEKEIHEGRFRKFPYLISRWSKASEEQYGRSPGMIALPEAKTLNVMAKTMLKGAQKIVDPPVQMPDDGFVRPLRTQPGGVNYYRAGSQDRVTPIFNDSRIDFGFEAIRERQQRVREAFFVDKLNLAENKRMTTTEVNQRIQEQLRFLGPLVGRQQVEFLRPLVDRVLDIMIRSDKDGTLIGEVPEELAGLELDVTYSSPIAIAQRASESESINAAFAASLPIIQADPTALDVIDTTGYVKEQFAIHGASRKVLRSNEEVQGIRDSRQQAQEAAMQQQQQAVQGQQMQQAAPMLKAMKGQ